MKFGIEPLLENGLIGYSLVRSAGYAIEYGLLTTASKYIPSIESPVPSGPLSAGAHRTIERETIDLFRRDSENILHGIYPASVLKPESPFRHLLRLPRIIAD